jgi:hypothetical protein
MPYWLTGWRLVAVIVVAFILFTIIATSTIQAE